MSARVGSPARRSGAGSGGLSRFVRRAILVYFLIAALIALAVVTIAVEFGPSIADRGRCERVRCAIETSRWEAAVVNGGWRVLRTLAFPRPPGCDGRVFT